ncbi:MAG: sensor domain-containing diguanylate cyclase [Planctomycetes bacterium]|nr:sensor domain-containing diguanylate cyclase [Planctomycetota bacterium]
MSPANDWIFLLTCLAAGLIAIASVVVLGRRAIARAKSEADVATRRAAKERERYEAVEKELKLAREKASPEAGVERTVLDGLWRALRDIGACATKDDVGQALGRAVVAALGPKQWMIFLAADADADGKEFVVSASGGDETIRGVRIWKPGARLSAQQGKVGLVARRRTTLDQRDLDAEPPIVREQISRTEPADFRLDLIAPVLVGERVVAILAVGDPEPIRSVSRTTIELISEFASVVLRSLAAREKAQRHANHDTLTGVGNKSWFNATAAEDLYTARQSGGRATLVLFGIDHFQRYVRRNGHQAGDRLVRGIAQVLRPLVKDGELLARWSGDEFVVMLPSTALPDAWAFATRARRAVSQVEWPFAADLPGGRVTLCAGISCFPGTGDTLESLIEAAAQTLNEARVAGGDTTGSILFDPKSERLIADAAEAAAAARATESAGGQPVAAPNESNESSDVAADAVPAPSGEPSIAS